MKQKCRSAVIDKMFLIFKTKLVEHFINETYFYKNHKYPSESLVTLIFSIMVAIYTLGGLSGSMGMAYLSENFGRRGGLLINNAFVFVAAALGGFSKMARSYEMLIISRFIIGFNSGLNAGLATMYLTEISPVHLRGAVGTIYQLNLTFSILISQIFGLPEIFGTETRWPILFGLIVVPSFIMLATLPLCPESPKFTLIKQDKDVAAQKALTWLRGTDDVLSEMDDMRAEFEEMKLIPKVTLKEMWSNMELRRPLIISVVVMLSQQFSGINAVIFYSTDILQNAGVYKPAALYVTLGMGSINVLTTVVSVVLVERAGRRTMYLIGLGGMMIITIILTISLVFTPKAPWLAYISILCVLAFVILFASGPGSIPWFLVSELFGQGTRPIATSIALAANWSANFVEVTGNYTFLVFTILLAMFWLFTYNKVPETKGRTIEEITAVFKEKSST